MEGLTKTLDHRCGGIWLRDCHALFTKSIQMNTILFGGKS